MIAKPIFKVLMAILLVALSLILVHELLLKTSNRYLVLNWEKGRSIKRTDLRSFTKNATSEEIGWLVEYLLDKGFSKEEVGVFSLFAAEHAERGDRREIRLVRRIADDRRYPLDIREAALTCLTLVCLADKEEMQVLRNVAKRNDDTASKYARDFLIKIEVNDMQYRGPRDSVMENKAKTEAGKEESRKEKPGIKEESK